MSAHINEVLNYLDKHPVRSYDGDCSSLLEMIHYVYTASNPINNEKIREDFKSLGTILDKLSREDDDKLFNKTCELCFEHEQLAFSHGILVGMHLMTELNALP